MKADAGVLSLLSTVLAAFGNVEASTEIENAVSPDEKWTLTMKVGEADEFRCEVLLKNQAAGKLVTSFNVDEFIADDVRFGKDKDPAMKNPMRL